MVSTSTVCGIFVLILCLLDDEMNDDQNARRPNVDDQMIVADLGMGATPFPFVSV